MMYEHGMEEGLVQICTSKLVELKIMDFKKKFCNTLNWINHTRWGVLKDLNNNNILFEEEVKKISPLL
jgi:hypothetical protein